MTGGEFVHRDPDAAGDAAVGRNPRERDLDQFADVAFDEGGRFERCGEDFGVDAVAGVIDAGVAPGERRDLVRFARKQARPDFGADPRAVAVLPLAVVAEPRERREKTVDHVELADAVFVPRSGDEAEPVFAENALVNPVEAVVLDGAQPDELKVEVVVRGGMPLQVLRVERHVEDVAFSLHRSAEGAADVLAGPAAEHLVAVLFAVHEAFARYFRVEHVFFSLNVFWC